MDAGARCMPSPGEPARPPGVGVQCPLIRMTGGTVCPGGVLRGLQAVSESLKVQPSPGPGPGDLTRPFVPTMALQSRV